MASLTLSAPAASADTQLPSAFGPPFALGAGIAVSAPVSVGPYLPSHNSEVPLQMTADPAGGAWLWYGGSGGEQLRRIAEDGSVTAVTLPAGLRGDALTFVSFRDGWSLATDKSWIAKRTRSGCCATLIAAELSPSGVWTEVQALSRPGAVPEGPEAVEVAGHVELGWRENEFLPDGSPDTTLRVALAPLGGAFHRSIALSKAFPRDPGAEAEVAVKDGRLYSRTTLGDLLEEAPVSAIGTLGRFRSLRSRVVESFAPTAVFEPNGSELWIDDEGAPVEELASRLRAPHSSRLRAPIRIATSVEDGEEFAQAPDGRGLLSFKIKTPTGGSKILAAAISPTGEIGPARVAAFDPAVTDGSYRWAGAIGDGGDQLLVWTDVGGDEEPARLWGSAATPACPTYSPPVELTPDFDIEDERLSAIAGPKGVFHVAWVDSSRGVQVTSSTAACDEDGPAP